MLESFNTLKLRDAKLPFKVSCIWDVVVDKTPINVGESLCIDGTGSVSHRNFFRFLMNMQNICWHKVLLLLRQYLCSQATLWQRSQNSMLSSSSCSVSASESVGGAVATSSLDCSTSERASSWSTSDAADVSCCNLLTVASIPDGSTGTRRKDTLRDNLVAVLLASLPSTRFFIVVVLAHGCPIPR